MPKLEWINIDNREHAVAHAVYKVINRWHWYFYRDSSSKFIYIKLEMK